MITLTPSAVPRLGTARAITLAALTVFTAGACRPAPPDSEAAPGAAAQTPGAAAALAPVEAPSVGSTAAGRAECPPTWRDERTGARLHLESSQASSTSSVSSPSTGAPSDDTATGGAVQLTGLYAPAPGRRSGLAPGARVRVDCRTRAALGVVPPPPGDRVGRGQRAPRRPAGPRGRPAPGGGHRPHPRDAPTKRPRAAPRIARGARQRAAALRRHPRLPALRGDRARVVVR